MVDKKPGLRAQDRFAAIGGAQARRGDHRQVVGAVAEGAGFGWGQPAPRRQFLQGETLGIATEDRLFDPAGQTIVLDHQPVGPLFVETAGLADQLRKTGKSAGHQRTVGAVGTQGRHQASRPGGQHHALRGRLQNVDSEARQQGHPLYQGVLEIQFAGHAAGRDLGDSGADGRHFRQFVDHFLADADAFMFEHYNDTLTTQQAILKDWKQLEQISRAGKISVYRMRPDLRDTKFANASYNDKYIWQHKEIGEKSKQLFTFPLACFLIGAQPHSYFCYNWGWGLTTGPLVDYPEFKRPLGNPKGNRVRKSAEGWIFTREFEHASVWLDLDKRQAKIDWHEKPVAGENPEKP